MYMDQREATAHVDNISRAILQLELFDYKAQYAVPVIEQVISEIEDCGTDARDEFRRDIFIRLRDHLLNIHPSIK